MSMTTLRNAVAARSRNNFVVLSSYRPASMSYQRVPLRNIVNCRFRNPLRDFFGVCDA